MHITFPKANLQKAINVLQKVSQNKTSSNEGHPDARVAIGLLASRKRVAALLDTQPENLGKMLCKSVEVSC